MLAVFVMSFELLKYQQDISSLVKRQHEAVCVGEKAAGRQRDIMGQIDG